MTETALGTLSLREYPASAAWMAAASMISGKELATARRDSGRS